MTGLYGGYAAPGLGNLGETFFVGHFGKFGIEFAPLFVFAGCCRFQIFECGRENTGREGGCDFDHTAFEEFEEFLGVFFLLFGGFVEDGGNLFIALFLGYAGKIYVTASGL